MVKNIIFDIGGVLAEPKSGHWFITANFWNIVDKTLVDEEVLKMSLKKYLYLQTQEPKTEKDEHEMFSKYYYNVLKDINYPNTSIDIANKLADDCVYNDDKFIFFDDDKPILEELSKQYNLYIISNGWPSSFRVLKNKGIDKYFRDILISSMFATTKEEKLFDIFIEKYKEVNPSESLYIDDRRHILQKAKEYGFNLLLMDRHRKYSESDFKTINNMNDILEVLE
ncbi:HAD family hydrolase [Candidatus Saccharibacteria bacterium]|nr:HAD family hydrolase [Candidatus Saccharibacteria bacterium]